MLQRRGRTCESCAFELNDGGSKLWEGAFGPRVRLPDPTRRSPNASYARTPLRRREGLGEGSPAAEDAVLLQQVYDQSHHADQARAEARFAFSAQRFHVADAAFAGEEARAARAGRDACAFHAG